MKYLTLSALLCFMFIFQFLYAQAPDTLWTKTFGGGRGNSVQQTTDGGYIVAGEKNGDVLLIKTDASGDTLWTKTFGGGRGNYVQQTADGGYIVAGEKNGDVLLIKTDTSGDTLWTKTFGGGGGNSVQQTADGGYIITGLTGYIGEGTGDIWLIKTDASGDSIWTKIFGGNNEDEGIAVRQTTDGGYIITGFTNGAWYLQREAILIRTNAIGDSVWAKKFRNNGNELQFWDHSNSVQQTNDGGYILTGTGYPEENHYDGHIWLIKTDSLGDTLWMKTFGKNGFDRGISVQQTIDEGYIIAGEIESPSENYGTCLIRTDSSGDTLWTKTFTETFSTRNMATSSLDVTADGGYIILTNKNWDAWLIKTTVDPTEIRLSNFITIPSEFNLRQNYPNPFNPNTTIEFSIPKSEFVTLKIYNLLGQKVTTLVSEKQKAGTYKVEWVALNMSSGIYFYLLQAGTFSSQRKAILLQ